MTNKQIIDLVKEKSGKDITEQEAQDYLSGKMALPDEALDIVSGGSSIGLCPECNSNNMLYNSKFKHVYCGNCAYTFLNPNICTIKCPQCGQSDFITINITGGTCLHCRSCHYIQLLQEGEN